MSTWAEVARKRQLNEASAFEESFIHATTPYNCGNGQDMLAYTTIIEDIADRFKIEVSDAADNKTHVLQS